MPEKHNIFPSDSIDAEGYYTRCTDYYGPWEYVNGRLNRINIPGGFIYGDSVYYNISDHQGNIRQVWNATTGQTMQDNHYYPYGAMFGESASTEYVKAMARNGNNYKEISSNPYRYSGKEWQPDFGLNLYDFAARQYDPALGRFINPDPLNSDYPHLSAYLYCAANPINATDPTGLKWGLDNLSEEDKARFEAMRDYWQKKSKELFVLYQLIDESDIIFKVQYLDSPDESLSSQMGEGWKDTPVYISDKTNDGSWTFNIVESNGPTIFNIAEDMFHCYQQDNISEYVGSHNMEYEAKLFALMAIFNNKNMGGASSAFYFEPNLDYVGVYNLDNSISNIREKLNSDMFKYLYFFNSNIFAWYNRFNNIGNGNYKIRTDSNSPPISLLKLYNSIKE